MAIEVIECEEFGGIELEIDRLLVDGEIALDSRITERGYLNFSLVKGRVVFRADRYVGLIPLNDQIAIRVRPRADISNIAHMIVRSGIAPTAIPSFSRGYFPRFEVGTNVERIYAGSLVAGLERVVDAGLMKSYVAVENPPPWRGRLLVSDTIRRHRARNICYRSEFEFMTLSYSGVENIGLRHAARRVEAWLHLNDPRSSLIPRLHRVIEDMPGVPDFQGRTSNMLQCLATAASRLPLAYDYYRDPLWTAYLVLQGTVPDPSAEGFITLDSLVVDLSKVFEAYVRRILVDRADALGLRVVNGEEIVYPLFVDAADFRVKPDIVLLRDADPLVVLDAKYKPDPKESDRYEVLSFMEALGIYRGAFICPYRPGSASRYMGVTTGGKALSVLRFDLAALDLNIEADRFVTNVLKLIDGATDYI